LEAVLSTLEIAYAKSHEDAACEGSHASFASEVLELTRALVEMVPKEPAALALAAIVRYAEARRPARLDDQGSMVPLSEQDPALWQLLLIAEADSYLKRAWMLGPPGARTIQAAIHGTWCWRKSLQEAAPWPQILALYDALLVQRDDSVVRLNRAVALAEVAGPEAGLREIDTFASQGLEKFLPYQVLRADLLGKSGRPAEARVAYVAALALSPAPAERLWLERQKNKLSEH
jgi:RNA polymerase sigma-70 factor (ECF subfamily)